MEILEEQVSLETLEADKAHCFWNTKSLHHSKRFTGLRAFSASDRENPQL